MADESKAKGNAAFSSGNFAEAITHFSDAVDISPNNHILYSNRSAAHASLSNFTQALTDAKKTVEIKPDWSKGYSRLGAAYFGLKNYSHAVSSYKKGLEIDPDNDALKCGLSDADSALERREEVKKAFQSAKSVDDKLKGFGEMESYFQESELGFECFVVAETISRLGNDFEKVLCFGKRALTILIDDFKRTRCCSYLLFADVLCLLGSTCLDLKRFDESLGYLNRAEKNLSKVKGEADNNLVLHSALHIQTEMYNVKAAMGNREEAVVHSVKLLDIKEKLMEAGSVKLGEANKDVSEAYIEAFDTEKALPFCLKALDIYTEKLGSESVEVAEVRRLLAIIYQKMGEYEKSFELNRLAMAVLKKTTQKSHELLTSETENANTLVNLGRYEEAIEVLKTVVSRDDIDDYLRVKSSGTMARALCYSGRFTDAGKYITVVQRILEEKKMEPMFAAVGFADMSVLYQKENDFETAISLMKKALSVPQLPQVLLPQLCAALASLISKSGKEKEEVSYLEAEVDKLKVYFGPEHCVVGYGYSNLGIACMGSGKEELGAKYLADAKHILDATLGPHHLTSLRISHGLSVLYGTLGRYNLALEIAEKVVGGMKGLDPSELQFMHEAVKHLDRMKESVAESTTRASSQSENK